MGSSRPRNSTRAAKARSVKDSPSRRRAADRPPAQSKPRIPPAIELAIDEQRESVGTAISLLYCLHSTLRHQVDGAGPDEGEAVDDAAEWADLADITAMLLVRLHAVHSALDSTEIVQAKIDPERLALTEMARELGIGTDDREAS